MEKIIVLLITMAFGMPSFAADLQLHFDEAQFRFDASDMNPVDRIGEVFIRQFEGNPGYVIISSVGGLVCNIKVKSKENALQIYQAVLLSSKVTCFAGPNEQAASSKGQIVTNLFDLSKKLND